jgi:hypothetical protein
MEPQRLLALHLRKGKGCVATLTHIEVLANVLVKIPADNIITIAENVRQQSVNDH